MYIEKTYRVNAPVDKVWHALLDLETLATCIPGCERVEKIDNTTYAATIKTKVASISAEFKGRLTVLRVEAPRLLEAQIRGQDSKLASLLSAKTRAEIKALSPTETAITCAMDAQVGGKLGALGSTVIKAKALEMLDRTFENARDRLLGESSEAQLDPENSDSKR